MATNLHTKQAPAHDHPHLCLDPTQHPAALQQLMFIKSLVFCIGEGALAGSIKCINARAQPRGVLAARALGGPQPLRQPGQVAAQLRQLRSLRLGPRPRPCPRACMTLHQQARVARQRLLPPPRLARARRPRARLSLPCCCSTFHLWQRRKGSGGRRSARLFRRIRNASTNQALDWPEMVGLWTGGLRCGCRYSRTCAARPADSAEKHGSIGRLSGAPAAGQAAAAGLRARAGSGARAAARATGTQRAAADERPLSTYLRPALRLARQQEQSQACRVCVCSSVQNRALQFEGCPQHFLVASTASLACGGESERAAGRQVTGLSSTGSATPGAATGSGWRPLMPVCRALCPQNACSSSPGPALPLCRVTRLDGGTEESG